MSLFLRCRLCNQPFDTQKYIPLLLQECGHTVCKNCITESNGILYCPEDEYANAIIFSTFYNQDIDQYTINNAILNLSTQQQRKTQKNKIKTQNLDELLTPPDLLESLHVTQLQQDETYYPYSQQSRKLIDKINNKFQDIKSKLELRQMEVLQELNKLIQSIPYNQNIDDIILIDFQLQMDMLAPRYCQLRKQIDFQKYSNTNSSSKRIFEESEPITIRQLLTPNRNPLQEIIAQLNRSENLESFSLKSQQLTDDDAIKLSQSIKHSQSYIRCINISNNSISDLGFIAILESLWMNKTVKLLKFKNNRLTQVSIIYLLKAYQTQKHNYLQQIYLKGNECNYPDVVLSLQKLGLIIYV